MNNIFFSLFCYHVMLIITALLLFAESFGLIMINIGQRIGGFAVLGATMVSTALHEIPKATAQLTGQVDKFTPVLVAEAETKVAGCYQQLRNGTYELLKPLNVSITDMGSIPIMEGGRKSPLTKCIETLKGTAGALGNVVDNTNDVALALGKEAKMYRVILATDTGIVLNVSNKPNLPVKGVPFAIDDFGTNKTIGNQHGRQLNFPVAGCFVDNRLDQVVRITSDNNKAAIAKLTESCKTRVVSKLQENPTAKSINLQIGKTEELNPSQFFMPYNLNTTGNNSALKMSKPLKVVQEQD